ncbi:hypothetical protein Goarm_021815, partial [Gossypium armourianum]|nr:hypothetical protein [Gossypium armourianum]
GFWPTLAVFLQRILLISCSSNHILD